MSTLQACRKCLCAMRTEQTLCRVQPILVSSKRGAFDFWKKKPSEEEAAAFVESSTEKRKISAPEQKHLTKYNLKLLKAKRSLDTKQGYKPPNDVEEKVKQITLNTYLDLDLEGENWRDVSLETDTRLKYKVLSKLIKEFDHDIPNNSMNEMKTISDALEFFSTEVRATSSYDDMGKLKLPPNLNIQLEYKRFDPETDPRPTAFPGRNSTVTSLKYRRKYKDIITTEDKPGYTNHYYDY